MKNLFGPIFYSHFYISLCSIAAYLYGTWMLTFTPFVQSDYIMAAMVFASTLATYTLTRKKVLTLAKDEDLPARVKWWLSKQSLFKVFMAMAVLIFLVGMFFVQLESLIILGLLGIISVFYSVKIPVINISLRQVPLLKTIWIALIWASIASFLPLYQAQLPALHYDFWMEKGLALFLQQFLFILAITIPFDIRDIELDIDKNIKSIPILIGAKSSLYLSVLLLATASIFFDLNAILTILSIVFIAIGYAKKQEWYYLVLLDSTIILQFLLCGIL